MVWLHLVLVLSLVGQRGPVLVSGWGGQAEDLGQARRCSAAQVLGIILLKGPSSAAHGLYPCRHRGVSERAGAEEEAV